MELVVTLRERERERERKETKKRDRGRKIIWAQGLVAARAAEATARGRDGELDRFLRVVALGHKRSGNSRQGPWDPKS